MWQVPDFYFPLKAYKMFKSMSVKKYSDHHWRMQRNQFIILKTDKEKDSFILTFQYEWTSR